MASIIKFEISQYKNFITCLCLSFIIFGSCKELNAQSDTLKEKTVFQTIRPWAPEIDVRSDVAIVYSHHDDPDMTFEERVASWRARGYNTHFMTGIAWGDHYQDYFLGRWDGKNHYGEAQVERNGDTLWHGLSTVIPYIVPSSSFSEYMNTTVIEKVIDAGISSIYLEEPEFWAKAGYSSAFKEKWQQHYGFPWRPQHESPENTWLSNKLKYQLYYDIVNEVSSYAKEYGEKNGIDVKIYIPNHSLVNYSAWQIVSPEASLASLPGIDGYIAQVWTGTARTPTYFDGESKERVFENAFLEYGSMVSMTAPTGRKIFFLTDPVEDAQRDWADYKRNYEATFTAQLLYPMVINYEVMPWPGRIYTGRFRLANSEESVLIPKYYSTQMQVMINTLNDMPLSNNAVSGTNEMGVLMGNSLMFQRFPTHNGFEDPGLSNFYGQTLPLLIRGVPVQTVHMENLSYDEALEDIEVLIMSYSNMKPLSPKVHQYLADWVMKGGVLIYVGRDDDPYQTVMEWWNTNGNNFEAPSEHLFKLMNINPSATNTKFKVEEGTVHVLRQNPKEFVMKVNGDQEYLDVIKSAYEKDAKAGELEFKNNLHLQRGPYDIVSVMDESVSNQPFVINEQVIDLFDPELPVLSKKSVNPGEQAFLYNLSRIENKSEPKVLASASRISDEVIEESSYSFVCKSPSKTINSMRILLPDKPKESNLTNDKGEKLYDVTSSWNDESNTFYLRFENDPEGINVKLIW